MKYYVGVSRTDTQNFGLIFKSDTTPTTERHPGLMALCFGPYRTKKEAHQVAEFQGYILNGQNVHRPPVWNGEHNDLLPWSD